MINENLNIRWKPQHLWPWAFFLLVFLIGCESTYKRQNIKEHIQTLAKTEYELDVEVEEVENTVGVQFYVPHLASEIMAPDQLLWTRVDNLLMVLRRVCLSMDDPPEFFVLEVVDQENPRFRFLFTRYVPDVLKAMAEVTSVSHYLDSLVMEFVVGQEKRIFDPQEVDMVQMMLLALESSAWENEPVPNFKLTQIRFTDFIAQVAANRTRRLLRERNDIKKGFVLRKSKAEYNKGMLEFNILLDLVPIPGIKMGPQFFDNKIFPWVASECRELFKVYKFGDFENITVMESNSGKILTFPKK